MVIRKYKNKPSVLVSDKVVIRDLERNLYILENGAYTSENAEEKILSLVSDYKLEEKQKQDIISWLKTMANLKG